ncbi:MAG: hypothetical protein LBF54_03405 [Holosporaceae bacterium]|nr:hypothetical protein [Holosporaceae bacterium]
MKKVLYAVVALTYICEFSEGMDSANILVTNFSNAKKFCEAAVRELQIPGRSAAVDGTVRKKIDDIAAGTKMQEECKLAILEKIDSELKSSFPFVTKMIHKKVNSILGSKKDIKDIYEDPVRLGVLLWRGICVGRKSITDTELALRVLKLLCGRDNAFLSEEVYPVMRQGELALYVPG